MLVRIRWQGRDLALPLSQLAAVDPDEPTAEAIGDWYYWVKTPRVTSNSGHSRLGGGDLSMHAKSLIFSTFFEIQHAMRL
jgi:Calcium binding